MLVVLFVQNSSLVLTSDTRTREPHEHSGEPESLWGRMRGKMGDRVKFDKPELLDERKKKLKAKYETPDRTREKCCSGYHVFARG